MRQRSFKQSNSKFRLTNANLLASVYEKKFENIHLSILEKS